MQVALRHRDQIRERAVVIEDAEHGAIRAVRVQAGAAGVARPARAVDLADHPAAGQGAGFGDADELVAEHAAESHVALDQLKVGFADAGARHAHQHLAVTRVGGWSGILNRHMIVEHDGAHPRTLSKTSRTWPTFTRKRVSKADVPHRLLIAAALLACALLHGTAAAQSAVASSATAVDTPEFAYAVNEPKRALKEGKVARAVRVTSPPIVDGALGDEVWTLAPVASGFMQRDPDNGQSMTRQTRIQIAYDDRFLYVAVTCFDDSKSVVSAGLGRRDEQPPTDMIMIALDPRHDHQTGYAFQTNPSGWQGDLSTTDDDRNDRDYNSVWEVRSAVDETGWTAEFRIPFSQIRFTASPEPGQVWGFNVQRQIRRLNENGTWVPKPRGERGEVSLYGHLVFDRPIAPPRRLELTPYTLARSAYRPGTSQEGGAAAGMDMRVGLGPDATLAATINPDFGQVEQDPAVLNLSVFETFFPEKRPFFLEESRTFVPPYGNFQLFHSRRIGRAPGRLPLGTDDVVSRSAG